jgi:hypothetical protein
VEKGNVGKTRGGRREKGAGLVRRGKKREGEREGEKRKKERRRKVEKEE